VHLRDRGRGQRLRVELGIGLGQRPAQRLLDDARGLRAVERLT
jgi:hypothetical protein